MDCGWIGFAQRGCVTYDWCDRLQERWRCGLQHRSSDIAEFFLRRGGDFVCDNRSCNWSGNNCQGRMRAVGSLNDSVGDWALRHADDFGGQLDNVWVRAGGGETTCQDHFTRGYRFNRRGVANVVAV